MENKKEYETAISKFGFKDEDKNKKNQNGLWLIRKLLVKILFIKFYCYFKVLVIK